MAQTNMYMWLHKHCQHVRCALYWRSCCICRPLRCIASLTFAAACATSSPKSWSQRITWSQQLTPVLCKLINHYLMHQTLGEEIHIGQDHHCPATRTVAMSYEMSQYQKIYTLRSLMIFHLDKFAAAASRAVGLFQLTGLLA